MYIEYCGQPANFFALERVSITRPEVECPFYFAHTILDYSSPYEMASSACEMSEFVPPGIERFFTDSKKMAVLSVRSYLAF
jgi:hypothetical protein